MAKFIWIAPSAFALFIAPSVDAHMKLRSPVPYGLSSLDNSPLAADGSDFPCKQRPGVYELEGAENILVIGEPNMLSFEGSAVHGGGSCQISLTTDLQPTNNSRWMVIKSIEGGCPASIPGNFPTNSDGEDANALQYIVPEGIEPGEYTIAWSWLNKIGNREFYMNCGPATVIPPKKKGRIPEPIGTKGRNSFPDMYVANLASINECETPESFDYHYPDPGSDVQRAGTGPFIQLTCGGARNTVDATATTGATIVDLSYPSTPGPTTEIQNPSTDTNECGSRLHGQLLAGGRCQDVGFNGATTSAIPSEKVKLHPDPNTDSGGSTSAKNATGYANPCMSEGTWFCDTDGKSARRCANGVWSALISLRGMRCNPGISDEITLATG
jgi:hypothetical protein